MSNLNENKNISSTNIPKNEGAPVLEEENELQPSVSRVPLKKSYEKRPQYSILPAGGMHFAIPDLNTHERHFSNPNGKDINSDFIDVSQEAVTYMDGKENKRIYPKLPFGLELTAGSGRKKMDTATEVKNKKAALPSQALYDSASFLKSYFSFSNEKDSSSKTDDNEETVKNKFMGLWNNMKYGWSANLKTNFSHDTPIYLLGRVYHKAYREEKFYGHKEFLCSNIEGFKKDFMSLGWFTYRRKFPPLPETGLTSDCGWGCMIRSGQMIMHTALRRHFLPHGWRFNSSDFGPEMSIHKQILNLFYDDPSPRCPFSLHNLVLFGHKMNKKAGNWYGPNCVAHMFKDAFEEGAKHTEALKRIGVYVAQDGAVYVQDVLDMCSLDECICTTKPSPKSKASNIYPKLSKSLIDGEDCDITYFDCDKMAKSLPTGGKQCSMETPPRTTGYKKKTSTSEDVYELPRLEELSAACSFDTINISDITQNEVAPLDMFVDGNRVSECDEKSQTFGDAITMRLRETADDSGAQTSNVPSICESCRGWRSCIILIPVRLGGAVVNPIYYNCISSLFLHDLCVGIIGGKPKHSLYFVGFQDGSLIHLDPHLNQDAPSLRNGHNHTLPTFHCSSPRKISITKMDPSATIGFYCHTRSQFYKLLEEAPMIATAKDGQISSPIFEFINGRSKDVKKGWSERRDIDGGDRSAVSEGASLSSSPFNLIGTEDRFRYSIDEEFTICDEEKNGTEFEEAEELVFD